jgi:hypothetical protein
LIAARAARQPVAVLPGRVEKILAHPEHFLPRNTEAVLVVGERRRAPRRMLPGLLLGDANGARVPVGWLPDAGEALAGYALAAARVLRRDAREPASLVVLGQWEDRFLRVGLRTTRWFEKRHALTRVFQWTAERISRTDMLRGLACGPALAMYFGHGRPRGWAGYHGVRAEYFASAWAEPLGALLALCCENASRHRTGNSFIENLALRGVFGGALAAVMKTRHEDNRRWGPALCESLSEHGATTLAELVMRADVPASFLERGPYRFIGDPAMPLVGARGSSRAASRVFAPAPDDPLPAWEAASA